MIFIQNSMKIDQFVSTVMMPAVESGETLMNTNTHAVCTSNKCIDNFSKGMMVLQHKTNKYGRY